MYQIQFIKNMEIKSKIKYFIIITVATIQL